MKKINNLFKAGGIITLLVIGGICGILYLQSYDLIVEKNAIEIKRHPYLVTAGPGEGTTQLINFQIRPHEAVPGTAYAVNVSTGTAYEYHTTGNASAIGSTPFSTAFDILVTVEVAWDDGYNQTTSAWDNNYMWCTLTCADLSIGANTNMTELEIASNSKSRWMHYYLNNGGSGYTIVLGESFNITSIKFWVMRPV